MSQARSREEILIDLFLNVRRYKFGELFKITAEGVKPTKLAEELRSRGVCEYKIERINDELEKVALRDNSDEFVVEVLIVKYDVAYVRNTSTFISRYKIIPAFSLADTVVLREKDGKSVAYVEVKADLEATE